jgi:hypothetical protein
VLNKGDQPKQLLIALGDFIRRKKKKKERLKIKPGSDTIIQATWEVEIERILVQGQSRPTKKNKLGKTPSQPVNLCLCS